METVDRPISTYILVLLSPMVMLFTLFAFSVADVHNSFDFLVPLFGVAQFVFVIGLFLGKLWGLIGYSLLLGGLCLATALNYFSKGEFGAALNSLYFLSPFLLLEIYYWLVKRRYFH